MIALIVADPGIRNGKLGWALSEAGLAPRETFTTDQADSSVFHHGATSCVLIVEADWLRKRAGSATWTSFLTNHADVPAVVVAHGGGDTEARQATREPHRILIEDPVDAMAVATAAQRVSSRELGPTPVRP